MPLLHSYPAVGRHADKRTSSVRLSASVMNSSQWTDWEISLTAATFMISYSFIFGVFNYAVGGLNYIVPNRWMIVNM